MTPTTYGRDFAYCLKSHGGVRGFNASLWRFLLRCTLFCHSVATFLTSVSSYEGGCGFEVLYYVLRSPETPSSDKMLIVAALSYLVLPIDLISAKRLPIIGWIDEAVSLVYAYKKVCRYVTPEIESEVDNILERWFPEGKYELIEE